MQNDRYAAKLMSMVPVDEQNRFRRELAAHMRNTFVRGNVAVGGALAFGAGTAVERAVDGATKAVEGKWGFGWLHEKLSELSANPAVEHLPELALFGVVLVTGARNYCEYRRIRRRIRREMEEFSREFMGRLDRAAQTAGGL